MQQLLALALLVGLVGCAAPSASVTDLPAVEVSGQPTTILVGGSVPDRVVEQADNYDALTRLWERELPAFLCTTVEELGQVRASFSDDLETFDGMADGFDADYFETHAVLFLYLMTPTTGEYVFAVEELALADDALTVAVSATETPDMEHCDAHTAWLMAVELSVLDREKLEQLNSVNGMIG